MISNPIETAANHWNNQTKLKQPARLRWWESRLINQHISRKYCGKPFNDTAGGDVELLRQQGRTFHNAISVGCGTAVHEMALIKAGLVEHFDLFEISSERIAQGTAKAEALGIASRITYHAADAFQFAPLGHYDLIYWKDALHHMLDVPAAVLWSRNVLKDGGTFFMNDFVADSYMQWSDRALEIASAARGALDAKYLVNPRRPSEALPIQRTRPNIEHMKQIDPTECADSARILPSVRVIFPNSQITMTGGVIYAIALSDVLANLDEKADASLIRLMMAMDDLCIDLGDSLYAVALAVKS